MIDVNKLKVGVRVRLGNCIKRPEFNGVVATVLSSKPFPSYRGDLVALGYPEFPHAFPYIVNFGYTQNCLIPKEFIGQQFCSFSPREIDCVIMCERHSNFLPKEQK